MTLSLAKIVFKSLQNELLHLEQLVSLLDHQANALFSLEGETLTRLNQQQEVLVGKLSHLKTQRRAFIDRHTYRGTLDDLVYFVPSQLQSKAASLLEKYRNTLERCYQLNKNNQTLCHQHSQVLTFIFNPDQLYRDQSLMLD